MHSAEIRARLFLEHFFNLTDFLLYLAAELFVLTLGLQARIVGCNLETGEPLWFGRERKKETLDDFFRSQLVSRQRKRLEAVCVDTFACVPHVGTVPVEH
jgi:hypothetical protein